MPDVSARLSSRNPSVAWGIQGIDGKVVARRLIYICHSTPHPLLVDTRSHFFFQIYAHHPVKHELAALLPTHPPRLYMNAPALPTCAASSLGYTLQSSILLYGWA